MANRTPRKPTPAQPPAALRTQGVWAWLQNPANQKTLRFIGAGFAAAIGILVTIGFIHKPVEITSGASPASSASQVAPAPTPSQNATASGGGNAINIRGDKNRVGTDKP